MLDKDTRSIIATGDPRELRDGERRPSRARVLQPAAEGHLMAAPTNHWKLGLFVVVGVVLALTTITFLGAESLKKSVVNYQTDFDESVQGLEVGSPVKFRGVTVGTVSAIGIAPDRRHVVVTSELAIADLSDLGLAVGKGDKSKIRVPPDLRMQIASQGITGVKFLQIDFFDIKDNPPPDLPFAVPDNYIPAAVSMMKNLEDSVVRAVNRIPEIAEGLVVVLAKVNHLLDEVQGGQLLEKGAATLARANQVLVTLQSALDQAHIGKLSSRADESLTLLNETITRSNALLARLDGDKGLMASAQRASNAVGDVAVNARSLGPELEETLRDVPGVLPRRIQRSWPTRWSGIPTCCSRDARGPNEPARVLARARTRESPRGAGDARRARGGAARMRVLHEERSRGAAVFHPRAHRGSPGLAG